MRSAAARRFAFLAALVFLIPLWARPSSRPEPGGSAAVLVGLAGSPHRAATTDSTAPPAVRVQSVVGRVLYGTRVDHGRSLATLTLVALLLLVGALPWSRLRPLRVAASALTRRRHAIALRAPPLASCA